MRYSPFLYPCRGYFNFTKSHDLFIVSLPTDWGSKKMEKEMKFLKEEYFYRILRQ